MLNCADIMCLFKSDCLFHYFVLLQLQVYRAEIMLAMADNVS